MIRCVLLNLMEGGGLPVVNMCDYETVIILR